MSLEIGLMCRDPLGQPSRWLVMTSRDLLFDRGLLALLRLGARRRILALVVGGFFLTGRTIEHWFLLARG